MLSACSHPRLFIQSKFSTLCYYIRRQILLSAPHCITDGLRSFTANHRRFWSNCIHFPKTPFFQELMFEKPSSQNSFMCRLSLQVAGERHDALVIVGDILCVLLWTAISGPDQHLPKVLVLRPYFRPNFFFCDWVLKTLFCFY